MRVRSTVNYIVIALAAVLTAALLFIRGLSSEAVYPIEHAQQSLTSKIKVRLRGALAGFSAAAENQRLKRELESLAVIRGDLERLETENDRLRKALGFVQSKREKWLAAEVLARGGSAAGVNSDLRVNRGALDGVKSGAVVMAPEGLVGLVKAVSPHTAVILPIYDASVKVACEVETGGAATSGILSGGSEEMLLMKYLKVRSQLPPRSRVLTSGRGGVFPRGLEIGTFSGIRQDANGLPQEGEVLPGVDFKTLEDVFIRCEK